jgi:hypothetical protein
MLIESLLDAARDGVILSGCGICLPKSPSVNDLSERRVPHVSIFETWGFPVFRGKLPRQLMNSISSSGVPRPE